MQIARPRSTWAGLRCFSPDGEPVIGPDPAAAGFHWAAALGGYGIQTSPAVGALCAAGALGLPVPDWLATRGVDPERLRPR
jgi:D-arginine dehydrogenase